MNYEGVIGLEVHVQLKTRSKIFCACPTEYGAEPNTQVCPVCLGYPGVLPVLNREAVRKTILTGLLIGAEIARFSKWDRKNYFYPDMPKNYQISQYDLPLCRGGAVVVGQRRFGIRRIHLEEDVAKSFHFETTSGVDFNRAGTPLMEIVSEPDLRTPDDAFQFLTTLKEMLVAAGVSDCDMEKGQLRCDANVSVRPVGSQELGAKIEIKNMNTISGARRALAYEIERQIAMLQRGEKLEQETRRWDEEAGKTFPMRTKENAHDYRYFPDPDLMPVVVDETWIEEIRCLVPELPEARRHRFVQQYGLPEYDAGVLVADKAVADFYEAAAQLTRHTKALSNWVMTELLPHFGKATVTPQHMAELVELVESGQISGKLGKDVLTEMLAGGRSPKEIVAARGLQQVNDPVALEALVTQAIAAQPKSVADYHAGNKAALNALVGQVMKLSKGKANPRLVSDMLARKLSQD